ncbi:Peroxin-3 [Russula earlei]|uniref:Peroxin-3 n=1 Tax=Russula earlei TaxID=71964 RepID=A0ACC0U7N0_9AGAM|nr:Peroxin-3 [Russula earlei]
MPNSLFYERRARFVRSAGIVGGLYLVGQYATARVADMRASVQEQRLARENMRRRFQQNMEDISFTILTYMPLLSKHILEEMDVEALTAELQSLSRAAKTRQNQNPRAVEQEQTALSQPAHHRPSSRPESLDSSVELIRLSDARSETSSASFASLSPRLDVPHLAEATVEQQPPPPPPGHPSQASEAPPSSSQSAPAPLAELKAPSESVVSSSAVSSNGDSLTDFSASSQLSASTRNKAELWREVKMLTVTRTLTALYSITLLTIFTNIQLSLLGRYKYIQSVIQLERDEDARFRLQYELSLSSMLFPSLVDMAGSHDIEALLGQQTGLEEGIWREGVNGETERKFLTLSWWILNVGWKDVGERVRRGVEEVFEGVSLKNKIGVIELHRLISDVRRRVEHEITFEGTERRINFLSTLLPPTSSALSHLLTRGGFPPAHNDTYEPEFTALLDETRDLLTSSEFALVLERALDRSTSLLFDGLSRNIFVGEEGEEGEVRLRAASVLPGLARWSSLALNGLPNELVDCLTDLHEVASFSAIIYSDYGDHFR